MAIALHNIGTIFTELGQFDIALNHLESIGEAQQGYSRSRSDPLFLR